MTRLVYIDCETTGLDCDRHEVYEIGLILREPDKADQEYRWWLPVDLAKADPMALSIGRYFERHPDRWNLGLSRIWFPTKDGTVEGGEGTRETRQECAQSLMRHTAGAHLVGAVPNFDAAFLGRLLRANGCCPAWHYHLVDVEALAAGYIVGQYGTRDKAERNAVTLPWNSNDLSRAVGVEPDEVERHTALGDARWAKAIYDAVMGDAS